MPAVHRVTDLRSAHATGYPTSACIEGSSNVFVNGLGVQRAGVDNFAVHTDGSNPHAGTPTPGSTTVFVNGHPVALVGDNVDSGCISTCIGPGSPNVFVGS